MTSGRTTTTSVSVEPQAEPGGEHGARFGGVACDRHPRVVDRLGAAAEPDRAPARAEGTLDIGGPRVADVDARLARAEHGQGVVEDPAVWLLDADPPRVDHGGERVG